jgi:hypothetical protein
MDSRSLGKRVVSGVSIARTLVPDCQSVSPDGRPLRSRRSVAGIARTCQSSPDAFAVWPAGALRVNTFEAELAATLQCRSTSLVAVRTDRFAGVFIDAEALVIHLPEEISSPRSRNGRSKACSGTGFQTAMRPEWVPNVGSAAAGGCPSVTRGGLRCRGGESRDRSS